MIKPLNGNILLKKELKENKTKSGNLLSEKDEEEEYARVIATSEVRDEKGNIIPLEIKEGDKVLFKSYSPTKVHYDNEDYILIEYKNIIGIID